MQSWNSGVRAPIARGDAHTVSDCARRDERIRDRELVLADDVASDNRFCCCAFVGVELSKECENFASVNGVSARFSCQKFGDAHG